MSSNSENEKHTEMETKNEKMSEVKKFLNGNN